MRFMMKRDAARAEELLKEAFIIDKNDEATVKEKATAYDRAIKAAPKEHFIYGSALALKANMYYMSYCKEDNEKVEKELLKTAAKFAKEAVKDPNNLLGIYVDAKVKFYQDIFTEDEVEHIIAKIKGAAAKSWSDHLAKMKIIRKEDGNAAKAQYAQQLLESDAFKDDFRVHSEKGYAAFYADQYDIAIEAYTKVIALEPRMLKPYSDAALSYGIKADHETNTDTFIKLLQSKVGMLHEYRKAREKAGLKDDELLLSNLCRVHFRLNEFPDFIKEAEKAAELFPVDSWSLAIMGIAYPHKNSRTVIEKDKYFRESMEAFDNAQVLFKKANKIDVDSPDILVCKSIALEKFGKFDEAVECIEYARKLITRYYNNENLLGISELYGFIDSMYIENSRKIKEQNELNTIDIENPSGKGEIDLLVEYNEQVTKANKKLNELIQYGGTLWADMAAQTMLCYSARAKLESGKANIIELQGKAVELKSSDAAAYSYFCGFYGTLKSAYEAAMQFEGKGFEIDKASKVSLASSFLTLMPFDKKVAKAALKDDSGFISKKKPFDVMYKFLDAKPEYEFASMAGQLSLNVTYAKQKNLPKKQKAIEKRYGKWVESFNKVFKEDALANEFYNDPNKLEGHTDAVALLKEIYNAKKLVQKPGVNFAKSMEVFAISTIIESSGPAKDYDGKFSAALKEVSGLVDHFAEWYFVKKCVNVPAFCAGAPNNDLKNYYH